MRIARCWSWGGSPTRLFNWNSCLLNWLPAPPHSYNSITDPPQHSPRVQYLYQYLEGRHYQFWLQWVIPPHMQVEYLQQCLYETLPVQLAAGGTAMWVNEACEPFDWRISKTPQHKVHRSRPVSLEVGVVYTNNMHVLWSPTALTRSGTTQHDAAINTTCIRAHKFLTSTFTSCIDSLSRHSGTVRVRSVYTAASQQMTLESRYINITLLYKHTLKYTSTWHRRETCMINVTFTAIICF